MSRRDTIIVAVLINTGLLAVLFMMAVHTDFQEFPAKNLEGGRELALAENAAPIKEPAKQEPVPFPIVEKDEIDQVLKNYKNPSSEPVTSVVKKEEPAQWELPPTRNLLVAEKAPSYVEITVKKGDYLEKIAKANGTTVSAILKANQLPSPRLSVGQVLRIPLAEEGERSPRTVAKDTALVEPVYYTLRSGDNPWKIAKQFHVGFGELLRLNDLDEEKARNLKPGDVLRVK